MRTVDIPELQDRLSTYIACARAGETILIRDHDTPVAQLVPLAPPSQITPALPEDITDEERELVAAGVLVLGRRPRNLAALDKLPWPKVEGNAGTQALLDDREESM